MEKNKKKKQISPTPQKNHVPTEFELAFQKAEEQKKRQIITESDNGSKQQPATGLSTKPKSSNRIDKAGQDTCKPVETKSPKRGYVPKKNKQQDKRPIISTKKTQITHKPVEKKKEKASDVKLSLKAVQKKSLSLDTTVQPEHIKDSTKPINTREEDSKTQAYDISTHEIKEESDIIIGFDFGTSSSKIVIRDKVLRTAYAVPLAPPGGSDNRYILPTKIYVTNQGVCNLSGEGSPYADLKIRLMENPQQEVFRPQTIDVVITAWELATTYIALMIRKARSWFLTHTKFVYNKSHIYWHLNLGIPSKNYDDEPTRKCFKTMAMAAWRISQTEMDISVGDLKNILSEADTIIESDGLDIDAAIWLHPDYVDSHPEVIMEVVGYAHSPLRKSGLHLLVDVGASTVDTATFIIHSDEGEDIYPLLETNVDKHGTVMLHHHRMNILKNSLEDALKQISIIDPIKPLHEPIHYAVQVDPKDVSKADKAFLHECSKKIGEVIRETKKCRDPYSHAWQNSLDVFICGGGSRLPIYRNRIEAIGQRISKDSSEFQGFNVEPIPMPRELEAPDLSHIDYDRLAVAYGLSFSSDEIGRIIPKKDVEDIKTENIARDIEGWFVDKDMC